MKTFKPIVPKTRNNSKPVSLHLNDDQQARIKALLKEMKPLTLQELLRQMVDHCLNQMEGDPAMLDTTPEL